MGEAHNVANYARLKRISSEVLARIPNHWTTVPARGGTISGTGARYIAPLGSSGTYGMTEVRLMTRPDGSQYVRLYRGVHPVDVFGRPQRQELTHFELEREGVAI